MLEGAALDQVLVKQMHVAPNAHRHEIVHRRLKLQKDIDVEPLRAPTDPPDDVVLSVPNIVGYVAAACLLQGGKVQLCHPRLPYETEKEVPHHFRMGEDLLVRIVDITHVARQLLIQISEIFGHPCMEDTKVIPEACFPSTGKPASRHSGKPFSNRRAWIP